MTAVEITNSSSFSGAMYFAIKNKKIPPPPLHGDTYNETSEFICHNIIFARLLIARLPTARRANLARHIIK